jgi:hypothetical protein
MITWPTREIVVEPSGFLEFRLPIDPPVQRGWISVGLSRDPRGGVVADALSRQLVIQDGAVPPFRLFARDVREHWRKGGRAWLVVCYADDIIARGELRLVLAS